MADAITQSCPRPWVRSQDKNSGKRGYSGASYMRIAAKDGNRFLDRTEVEPAIAPKQPLYDQDC